MASTTLASKYRLALKPKESELSVCEQELRYTADLVKSLRSALEEADEGKRAAGETIRRLDDARIAAEAETGAIQEEMAIKDEMLAALQGRYDARLRLSTEQNRRARDEGLQSERGQQSLSSTCARVKNAAWP